MTGGKETNDAVGKKAIWLPILIIGTSRAGKSTLCNTLLNKYEALESSALESVTRIVNEYSNDYSQSNPSSLICKNKYKRKIKSKA